MSSSPAVAGIMRAKIIGCFAVLTLFVTLPKL